MYSPFNVTFKNESSGPGTLTYQWDFGNGNTSTDKNPVNIYNANGNFQVKLTTTSSYGCVSTIDSTIPVSTYATAMNIRIVPVNQQVVFKMLQHQAPYLLYGILEMERSQCFRRLKPIRVSIIIR